MLCRHSFFTCSLIAGLLAGSLPVEGVAKKQRSQPEDGTSSRVAIIWSNPIDIESRDLFHGPGARSQVPRGSFTFVKEDLNGTSPKFVIKDQDEVKWRLKLGIEARPEIVASRIVWAVGYYADEDYFVRDLCVGGMPARLHRGQKLAGPDNCVVNARLKREPPDEKKIGTWRWRSDTFKGTREL